MNSNKIIDTLVSGSSTDLTAAIKDRLSRSIHAVNQQLEDAQSGRNTRSIFANNASGANGPGAQFELDPNVYTNISDMVNNTKGDFGGFTNLLDSLVAKNKRYYTIIRDYELMPILIPQINRVLMFLTNECLSPDVQNKQTFTITYVSDNDDHNIQDSINQIKKEMKLDNLLREVYMNRHKLGNEYYTVIDYNETFQRMLEMMKRRGLHETTVGMNDHDFIQHQLSFLSESIDEIEVTVPIDVVIREGVTETVNIPLSFENLNIRIDRSPIVQEFEDVESEIISEQCASYGREAAFQGIMNEDVVNNDRFFDLVAHLKNKRLQRCTIERLDPAKTFKVRIGGRTIGYFYVREFDANTANVLNFNQALKNQLLKTRAADMSAANASAEEVISKKLGEMIVNKFDSNIGVTRLEDIDLLHDFIRNNEIFRGDKRIVFYYEDEVFDMSRTEGSLLTNAVFFTKLYSTLLLNNIITKVLRGRGRQYHMVKTSGISPSLERYIQNAMASLTMPENNLGTLHGSFEQLMNPFNSSSDLVFPVEDTGDRFIETDFIPGQDVNMDDEFLRFLLNCIVSSFGLDSAVIDSTNGNLQFARTLTMESLQICNSVQNEQQDLHAGWEALCLRVLEIMGDEKLRIAIDQGLIKVNFFEPESLIIQNTIEDLNNAKSYAEALADIIPEFNEDGTELKRSKFIYTIVRDRLNIDWTIIDDQLSELEVTKNADILKNNIRKVVQEYLDNTEQQQYGDNDGDGLMSEEDAYSGKDTSEYGEYGDLGDEEL